MTVRPNCGVSRLYDLILHGALKLAINQHSCSLSRHSCHSRRCHNKKMQEQIFTINKVDTTSLRSSFKTGFFHNSPQILSLTASPCKDVRRMKWFQFKNTHVTPLDQWEFFVQNLDEGIKKKTGVASFFCFLCLTPVPFPILCTAKSQFSKIRPLRSKGLLRRLLWYRQQFLSICCLPPSFASVNSISFGRYIFLFLLQTRTLVFFLMR